MAVPYRTVAGRTTLPVVLERAFAEPDGFRRYVLSLTPSDVPAGEYTLEVRLRDAASGRLSEAFQIVEVGGDALGSP